MSKQIHDERRREQGRKKQVKFRCPESLLDAFDEWVEASGYDNRSSALRAVMRSSLSGQAVDYPRRPPTDESLATAYELLLGLANAHGIVPHEIAVSELASKHGRPKESITHNILHKLRKRGYLQQKSNIYGSRAWKLRGWDD